MLATLVVAESPVRPHERPIVEVRMTNGASIRKGTSFATSLPVRPCEEGFDEARSLRGSRLEGTKGEGGVAKRAFPNSSPLGLCASLMGRSSEKR